MKGEANSKDGRPFKVFSLTDEQERAIVDYYFVRENVKSLRDLAPILNSSVQGASNISLQVLAQWARQGRLIPNL